MKSVLIKLALAAAALALFTTTSCRPTANTEIQNANAPAQSTPTPTAAPPVTAGSGKSSANENAAGGGGAGGNGGVVTDEVKSELSTATREMLGIMLRGETKEAAERLTDDFKNTRPDGTIEDKAQFLANLKPFENFGGFIFDEFKVESLDADGRATVSGLVQAWGEDKKSLTGRFNETFVKRGGRWLLQSARNTELKPDK